MRRLLAIALGLGIWPCIALAQTHGKAAQTQPGFTETTDSFNTDDAAPQINAIVLQGLNKVTGHISRLEGPVGTVLTFGNLEIIPRRCWKSSPEERPENAALLDISELKPGEAPSRIFLGWMFSSSPGLSGIEHPVYDITVLSCETRKEPEKKEPDKDEKPKKPDLKK
jgi:hypothetical protein